MVGIQIAVDGQEAKESDIVRQVRGTDIVGSKVVITVRKAGVGQVFDVALVRGAWGAVERKEKLFILFEELHKLIKNDASKEQLEVLFHFMSCLFMYTSTGFFGGTQMTGVHMLMQAKLNTTIKEAKEYEKYRAISEMTIHDRLHDLQVCSGCARPVHSTAGALQPRFFTQPGACH